MAPSRCATPRPTTNGGKDPTFPFCAVRRPQHAPATPGLLRRSAELMRGPIVQLVSLIAHTGGDGRCSARKEGGRRPNGLKMRIAGWTAGDGQARRGAAEIAVVKSIGAREGNGRAANGSATTTTRSRFPRSNRSNYPGWWRAHTQHFMFNTQSGTNCRTQQATSPGRLAANIERPPGTTRAIRRHQGMVGAGARCGR